jgi:DivIVA domain-containing protein
MLGMDVTPRELRDSDISESFRGYNRDEVNELLDRAASTIEALEARIRQLSTQIADGTPSGAAPVPGADPAAAQEAVARTLVLAQRVADEAIADAKTQAAELVSTAEARSRQLVGEAEAEVRRVHDVERVRLEQELAALSERREHLGADVDALEAFERDYRDRLVRSIQADLSLLEHRVAATSAPRPVTGTAPAADATLVDDAASGTDGTGDSTQMIEATAAEQPSRPSPTIDLAEEQAAERAQLAGAGDDDSFFASLREAVSDDAPLTEDEERLFDADDERAGLRDVFRRRR